MVAAKQAMAILNRALDRGIRYFDTAWAYSLGQSEQRVGLVAKHRRDEMWIATKVRDTSQAGARRQLEESLNRLQTGFVDEWRLHDIYDLARLDAMTGPGGALEAAICAREEGLVRLIGISGHSNPQVQLEALRRFPFDSALVAVSVLDHFIHSFAEEFLPMAQHRGVAVVGMKVFGLGALADVSGAALRYALALPLTTVLVGCSTMEQLEKDLAIAESFAPLSGPERLALFREVLPLARPETVRWKAADWNHPSEWKQRVEPAGLSAW